MQKRITEMELSLTYKEYLIIREALYKFVNLNLKGDLLEANQEEAKEIIKDMEMVL